MVGRRSNKNVGISQGSNQRSTEEGLLHGTAPDHSTPLNPELVVVEVKDEHDFEEEPAIKKELSSADEDGVCFEPLNPELDIVEVKEEHDFKEEPAIKKELFSADEEEASNTDRQDGGLITRRFDGEECVKEEEIFVKSEFGSCAGSDNSALMDNNDGETVDVENVKPQPTTQSLLELPKLDTLKKQVSFRKSSSYYHCSACSYKSIQLGHMKYHLRTHTGENPLACKHCDYQARHPSSLKRHVTSQHTGERPYPCKLCNYKATLQVGLSRHMITHTAEKPYACDLCSFRTARLDSIHAHKLTHTGEKPYSCKLCNYKAIQLGNLSRHMRTHTGEKPYACDRCSFRAADLGNINVHKLTHTGEKPYSCKLCNYKAAQQGNLSRHMRTHSGEKPYACDWCSFRAADLSNINAHKLFHTGEKPFKCQLCEYKSTTRRCLRGHMIRTHPEAPPLPSRSSQRSKTSDSIGSIGGSNSSRNINSKGQRPADAESISSDTELDDEPYCTIDIDSGSHVVDDWEPPKSSSSGRRIKTPKILDL